MEKENLRKRIDYSFRFYPDSDQLLLTLLPSLLQLSFHAAHEVFTASILGWFASLSSRGSRFFRTLHLTCLSWVAIHNMAHGFINLHKPLRHNKPVICEGHELRQTLGGGEGQGGLACYSPRGCKKLDTTEQVNRNTTGIIAVIF